MDIVATLIGSGVGLAIAGLVLLAVLPILIPAMAAGDVMIPTVQDERFRLETAVTKTATFTGAWFDLGAGFAPGGPGMLMLGIFAVSAIDRVSADETYVLKLQEAP